MPFKPNDSNINKSGRPKGSLNNSTKIKQQIQSMLADLIHNELSTDKLLNTLDKASPTAKLKFYSDIMPFVIAKIDKDESQIETPKQIEINVRRNRENEGLFQYCPKCRVEH